MSEAAGGAGAALYEITYTPNYEDTFRIQRQSIRYHYSAVQRYLPWLMLLLLAGTIVAIIVWADDIVRWSGTFLPDLIAAWSPLILMLIAYLIWGYGYCYKLAPKLAARWIRQRSAPVPFTVAVGPEQIVWSSDLIRSEIAWPAIERVFTTKTGVCLLVSNTTMFVPHAAFKDREDAKAFVAAVLERVPERVREISLADRSVKKLLEA